jgi:SAM-dependent methyltransferase
VSGACAWCGRRFDDSSLRLPGRRVCAACGVATTDPWPDERTLERAYSGWYRPAEGRFAGPGDRVLRRTRGLLARRLDRIAPAGPVLDVGAGDGALLDALRARGRSALGLERESTRPDVMAAGLDAVNGPFAAVVFWHSLEHLPQAGAALGRAAELLVPGGVVVVALPNPASLQARAFGDAWLALDLPRHLVHVPAPALLARLRECGLEPERVSHLRGGQVVFGWLHGLVGRLPGRPDLYDAIRRPPARRGGGGGQGRPATLAAGAALLPGAAALALLEAALRRGGSVYVEARRPAILRE